VRVSEPFGLNGAPVCIAVVNGRILCTAFGGGALYSFGGVVHLELGSDSDVPRRNLVKLEWSFYGVVMDRGIGTYKPPLHIESTIPY